MEDSAIIDLYWSRDQRAIEETAGKYGSFLHSLVWNILHSRGDAEECVNDTYLRAWNAIPPARPAALRAWLGRIARNLSLDRWKAGQTQKRGGGAAEVLLGELDDCVPALHGVEKQLEDQEIAALISAFLRRLPAESRVIFLRRYWYGQELADIAAERRCGVGKVKSSLFRTRKVLRAYLEQEGVIL
ncbi:MAG: RNA polymerase sigma factor [Oscillibacter sp.]|nr:RNA polymerase sigma factor [Oscillibacter sp.]